MRNPTRWERLARLCAFALAAMLAVPAQAGTLAQVRASRAPTHEVVDVDATAFGPTAKVLAEHVHARASEALAEAEAADPAFRSGIEAGETYRVVLEPPMDGTIGYQVIYERLASDGSVRVRRASQCRLCTESELLEQVAATLVRLQPSASEAVRGGEATPTSTGERRDTPSPRPVVETREDAAETPREAARLGRLGKAGIGIGVVGLAAVGVGLGLTLRDPVYKPRPTYELQTREAGIATASVGGAAAIAGFTMLAVDASRRRKARARVPTNARMLVQPSLARATFGLSLAGSF